MKELYVDENLSYGYIIARVDVDNVDGVVERIEKNLRNERDLEEGKEDFTVQSFNDLLEAYGSVLNIIIGFVILAAMDWYLVRRTGFHIHQYDGETVG